MGDGEHRRSKRLFDDAHVGSFLNSFDNDFEAAISAIRSYASQQTSEAPVARRPKGEVILSVHDVTKRYKVNKQSIDVLKSVSLDIYKGEIVALTGPSGSGKSTLLHVLGCIDKPTSGQVMIEGRDVTKLRDGALSDIRKQKIGFVFQSFYLQPFLRLKDNLAVPAMFTDAKRQTISSKVASLLKQTGLEDRALHYSKELSGGQIQRAGIARALINDPHIILADEPTGNLDSANSQAIVELFKSIRDTLGTTIIIVTHDQDIARHADRIITLKDGAIV